MYNDEHPIFMVPATITEIPDSPFRKNFSKLKKTSEKKLPDKIRQVFPNANVWYYRNRTRYLTNVIDCYKTMMITYNTSDFFMCDRTISLADGLEFSFSMVEGTIKDGIIQIYRFGHMSPHSHSENYFTDLEMRAYYARSRREKLRPSNVRIGEREIIPGYLTMSTINRVVSILLELKLIEKNTEYLVAQFEPWKFWGSFHQMHNYKNWLFGTETYKIIEGTYENHYRDEMIVNRKDSNTISIIVEDFLRRKWAINVFRRYRQNNAAKIIQRWWLDQTYNPKRRYCQQRLQKEFNELIAI